MDRVHVRAGYRPWRGSHQVDPDESYVLVLTHLEVNGYWIWSDYASLRTEGPFMQLAIRNELPEDASSQAKEQHEKIFGTLDDGIWVDRTETETVYPVASLDMIFIPSGESALTEYAAA